MHSSWKTFNSREYQYLMKTNILLPSSRPFGNSPLEMNLLIFFKVFLWDLDGWNCKAWHLEREHKGKGLVRTECNTHWSSNGNIYYVVIHMAINYHGHSHVFCVLLALKIQALLTKTYYHYLMVYCGQHVPFMVGLYTYFPLLLNKK